MNNTLILILAICIPIFLLVQIRFILKIARFRKSSEHLPGLLFIVGSICEGLNVLGECCSCLMLAGDETSQREREKAKQVTRKFIEFDEKQQAERLTGEETVSTTNGFTQDHSLKIGKGSSAEGICPECQCPYKKGTRYCPNCGIELKK